MSMNVAQHQLELVRVHLFDKENQVLFIRLSLYIQLVAAIAAVQAIQVVLPLPAAVQDPSTQRRVVYVMEQEPATSAEVKVG